MKVLVFGEVLWDLIEGKYHLGGAPLNFAAHAQKCDVESTIISCLGVDKLGDKAYDLVKQLGVNTSMIQRCEKKPTGKVLVELSDGQPDFEILTDVAYDFIQQGDLNSDAIKSYDMFYFGTLIQRSENSRESLYHILDNFNFENVLYDVNLRKGCFSKSIIETSLGYCSILKVNDYEVKEIGEILFGEELSFESFSEAIAIRFKNIKLVVITVGKNGCVISHKNQIYKIPTVPVEVKDAVGAGDAFSAAFLCTYCKTNDFMRAGIVGNKVGAFVASSSGSIPEYSAEIKALL